MARVRRPIDASLALRRGRRGSARVATVPSPSPLYPARPPRAAARDAGVVPRSSVRARSRGHGGVALQPHARGRPDLSRERLVTSRLLLVVVGNVSRARVEALVAGSLGKLPRGDYRWTLPPAPVPPAGTRWLIDNRPLATTYMVGYFAGPPPTSQRYWAFRVATALLSSGLHQALRLDRKIGRASCRERGERAGAEGSLEREKGTGCWLSRRGPTG